MPFIPKGRVDSLYCDRIMPGFKDKCSVIGAINTYKSNLSDIEADFYAARRRYNTRVSRNSLLKPKFVVWKIKAKVKKEAHFRDFFFWFVICNYHNLQHICVLARLQHCSSRYPLAYSENRLISIVASEFPYIWLINASKASMPFSSLLYTPACSNTFTKLLPTSSRKISSTLDLFISG